MTNKKNNADSAAKKTKKQSGAADGYGKTDKKSASKIDDATLRIALGYEKPPKAGPEAKSKKPADSAVKPKPGGKKQNSGKAGPVKQREADEGSPEKAGATAGIITAICAGVMMCVVLLGGWLFVGRLDTVYPNISMDGIDIGGLSAIDATMVLENSGFRARGDLAVTVELPTNKTLSISAREAGVAVTATQAALAAYRFGRDGNVLSNTLKYLECAFRGAELTVESEFTIDEKYVRGKTNDIVNEINLDIMGSEITVLETYISVIKGTKSLKINAAEIYEMIAGAFKAGRYETMEYLPASSGDEDEIDIVDLYNSVFRKPVNAEYVKETDSVTMSFTGISFSIPQAQTVWDAAKNGEEIHIPLIITEPEISTEYLDGILFRDLLGGTTTALTTGYYRNVNVTLAAESVNGCILLPGEEFSYNETVGRRTREKGYQLAGAYLNGKEVLEIGGGICQVSSTMYNSALLSNLRIIDRTCHYFGVAYLSRGLDATVSWPSPDFKFKNDRDFPIKINAYTDLNAYTVTVEIYGTDTDGSYVVMETVPLSTASTYGATSYRCVYAGDGTLLRRTREDVSYYHYHVEDDDEDDADGEEGTGGAAEETPQPDGNPALPEENFENDPAVPGALFEPPEDGGEPGE